MKPIRRKRRRAKTDKKAPSLPSSQGTRGPGLRLTFQNGAKGLPDVGPHLQCRWSVPAYHAQLRMENGETVPEPVVGLMLVDTGSDVTCVANDVAEELGLLRVSKTWLEGVNSDREADVFYGQLEILLDSAVLRITPSVPGVDELNYHYHNAQPGGPAQARKVGVIGRDWLKYMVVTYDGPAGVFAVQLDVPSLQADFMVDFSGRTDS